MVIENRSYLKKTVPISWEKRTLQSVCIKLVVGYVGTCESYYTEKTSDSVMMIRTGDIKGSNIDFQNVRYIQGEFHEKNKKSQLKKGDILIARHGSSGHAVIYDSTLEANALNIVIVRINPEVIDRRYLVYLLDSEMIQKQIQELSAGSTQNVLNTRQIAKLQLLLPESREQVIIADVLSSVDGLISSLQKLVEKKKAIKQGAMQELLTGKKRLPGFSGEWNEGCIGDYCRCIRGVSYNGGTDLFPDENSYSFRLLRANNIQNGNFVPNDVQFVKKSCVSEEQVLHTNDILVCMANGSKPLVGKNCFLNVRNGVYTFGAFMGCIRARTPSTCMKYIFQIMNSTTYWENISLLLSGSSINNLRPNDILDMTYKFPTAIEQQAIAQVLSDMDSEIEQLEKKLAKYQQIKQGMMQELLTGRIRITNY